MTAYYNEIDPYAAQWLRNLIAAGHIAPGVVDERSIADVKPSDLFGFTQCHFFAGIGVWSYALRRAGWPDDRPVWTGSCPCQPFSAAGAGGGFDDERHLWPHWHHLIRVCRPPHVFGEQVASKDGLGWLDLVQSDMEGEAYALWPVDMCAAGVGAPHIRQRLWLVGEDQLADAASLGQRPGLRDRGSAGLRRDIVADSSGYALLADDRRWRSEMAHFDAPSSGSEDRERQADQLGVRSPPDLRLDYRHDAGPQGHAGNGGSLGGRARTLGPATEASISRGLDNGGGERRDAEWRDNGGDVREFLNAAGELSPSTALGPLEHSHRGSVSLALWGEEGGDGQRPDRAYPAPRTGRPGPTNGLWADADWLFCRDGKWRPVEPGTFPLAHGAASRVGRLRAYGNAIVAQAAEEVIATFLDHEHDAALARSGSMIGHNGGPTLEDILG